MPRRSALDERQIFSVAKRWDTLCTIIRDRARRLSVPLSAKSLKSLTPATRTTASCEPLDDHLRASSDNVRGRRSGLSCQPRREAVGLAAVDYVGEKGDKK